MKALDAQNHYEVLEVGRGARPEEIDRAYRVATTTWGEGSLALYSLFDERDAGAVRDRIQRAYRILSDSAARRAYDQQNFDSALEVEELAAAEAGHNSGSGLGDFEEVAALDASLEDGCEENESFDGPLLRRLRMQRGIEIADIAEVTKVSVRYMQALEDESFELLPAAVYVRGFLTAYARTVGLDPARVAASYMPRLEMASRRKGRGRLRARR